MSSALVVPSGPVDQQDRDPSSGATLSKYQEAHSCVPVARLLDQGVTNTTSSFNTQGHVHALPTVSLLTSYCPECVTVVYLNSLWIKASAVLIDGNEIQGLSCLASHLTEWREFDPAWACTCSTCPPGRRRTSRCDWMRTANARKGRGWPRWAWSGRRSSLPEDGGGGGETGKRVCLQIKLSSFNSSTSSYIKATQKSEKHAKQVADSNNRAKSSRRQWSALEQQSISALK